VNGARKTGGSQPDARQQVFGKDDPIGQLIKIEMLETLPQGPVKDPVFEVIGVISDAKNQGIQDPPMPEMLVPYTVTGAFDRGILVRTAGPPLAMLNAVRREIWAVDRNIALTFAGSLEDFLKQFSYAEPRFGLILLAVSPGWGCCWWPSAYSACSPIRSRAKPMRSAFALRLERTARTCC